MFEAVLMSSSPLLLIVFDWQGIPFIGMQGKKRAVGVRVCVRVCACACALQQLLSHSKLRADFHVEMCGQVKNRIFN